MLIPILKIDSNYRTEKILTGKIQYRTTLVHVQKPQILLPKTYPGDEIIP